MGAANLLSATRPRAATGAVPVGYVDPSTLLVVIADPANVLAIDDHHQQRRRVDVTADRDRAVAARGLGGEQVRRAQCRRGRR